jgi:D-3-phosphoglycerate dehydrogenase
MARKVLIATDKPFAAPAVKAIEEIFKKQGYEVSKLEKYKTPEDLHKAVATAEALIIRSDVVDAKVLDAAANLKIVVRAGAGYDNIDCEKAKAKGVVAMNTPGQNSNAVAEAAIGMMIFMARNSFDGSSGTELKDKTLALHAFGFVGKRMAHIAKGFDMNVAAYDPFLKEPEIATGGAKPLKSVEELYAAGDFVSIHIPATKDTKKSIGYNLLMKMKKGAVLVNTARKEVIDEDGLVKAFTERPDLKYVADVEPDCKAVFADKFKGRFYFTPKKLGAQTEEANTNAGIAAARQIVAFFEKGEKTFQVNK